MEHRILSTTGLSASRICLGTWIFGSKVSASESIRMVHYAMDAGINLFDTADSYFEGSAEKVLGEALEGRRDQVIIGSKVGYLPEGNTDLSPVHIQESVNGSLKRLKTDRLDICYFHAPDYDTPIQKSLEAINRLMEEGKIRHFGLSNYAAWQATHIHGLCEQSGMKPPELVQNMYNVICRGIEPELIPCAATLNLSVAVFNPLAGGILTGRYKRKSEPGQGSRFDWNKIYFDRFWTDANFKALDGLTEIAAGEGCDLIGLAYRWLAHQNAVDTIILGASSMEQLEKNLEVYEGTLSEKTLAGCDAIWKTLYDIAPAYCR